MKQFFINLIAILVAIFALILLGGLMQTVIGLWATLPLWAGILILVTVGAPLIVGLFSAGIGLVATALAKLTKGTMSGRVMFTIGGLYLIISYIISLIKYIADYNAIGCNNPTFHIMLQVIFGLGFCISIIVLAAELYKTNSDEF